MSHRDRRRLCRRRPRSSKRHSASVEGAADRAWDCGARHGRPSQDKTTKYLRSIPLGKLQFLLGTFLLGTRVLQHMAREDRKTDAMRGAPGGECHRYGYLSSASPRSLNRFRSVIAVLARAHAFVFGHLAIDVLTSCAVERQPMNGEEGRHAGSHA